ncbi:TadE/TadG family type IV pilus assembly protein [Wenxinia saemankumensis]|uniref:TadE-like protein n=1 Tax=Wenxinia saemankumensis TaxID=1447782 RepID=A0A1M6GZ63_9RHOB|nr:TadE/TadG family type IV pilus assembly protein [Wenxinia saemankumensis]SHJ15258.1 TadE-like protein [Wenxinia saemankumensis]
MSWLRAFLARDESGSATLEFVILLPGFILLLLSSFELGMLMTRHVMLDRALDLAVRGVRIGTLEDGDHDTLVAALCENLPVLRGCAAEVKLEMRRIDVWAGAPVEMDGADCVDHAEPDLPPRSWQQGGRNQLMILRVCALFDPMFPTTGLGASLPRRSDGSYALIATSSFVVEP